MIDLDVVRPPTGRRTRLRLGVAGVLALAAAVACTGENIFPLSVAKSGGGGLEAPTVEISTPAANAALTQGDSVQVTAAIMSTNALSTVTFSGSFTGGTAAYIQQVVSATGATDTTLSRFLQPSGTQTGNARVIVKATDVLGNSGADTVQVTIN
jgi:hypothetical protein